MLIRELNSSAFMVIKTTAIYKNKNDKLNDQSSKEKKSNDEFSSMLDEEIDKLTEKDNSSLHVRK